MRIRRSLGYFLLLHVLVFVSCKDLNKLISFNIDTSDIVILPEYPESLLQDTILANDMMMVVTDAFHFSNLKKFQANKTLPEKVEDVEAIDFTVKIDTGATDFSFASNYIFYLSPSGQFFDDIELCSIEFPDAGRNTLQFKMKPKKSEWLKIIKGNEYHLRLDYTMERALTKPVRLKCEMRFRLKAMPAD